MVHDPNHIQLTNDSERPISVGFLNSIHTDSEAAAILTRCLEIAEERNAGAARSFLHDTCQDEVVLTMLEKAFNRACYGKDGVEELSHPLPPDIHEQTRIILDSGLAHLMMERLPSDTPQVPPFDCMFWVQTDLTEHGERTAIYGRWQEEDELPYQQACLRATPGIPFGHDGHAPLSKEQMAVVEVLKGWEVDHTKTTG